MAEDLPGLSAAPVERWLRSVLPELIQDGPWSAEVISGGLSNITYRLRLPGGTAILRRPPLGHVLPRAHDMGREHRVLTALYGTPVPVPETLALCADPEVLGVTFSVMREVPGTVLRRPEDGDALTPGSRTALADALVRSLADLHAVDPDAVGLGDYGRRGDYCVRQIHTWAGQWQRSKTRDLPDMELLIKDLAVTLSYWHDRDDPERDRIPVSPGLTNKPGFPASRDVASAYADRTGRDLSNLPFYMGLALMKLAVICEGVHARYLGGQTVGEGYDRVGPAVPLLVARGLRTLGREEMR